MRVYVFVGKKLISSDTIAPILIELKKRKPLVKLIILTPDEATFDAIKANSTLFQLIKNNCEIRNLGGLSEDNPKRLFEKIIWAHQLFLIFLLMLFDAARVIHFGVLETPPRKWIASFNKKRVYYVESNGWGTGDLHLKFIANSRAVEPAKAILSSNNIVSFCESWPLLAVSDNKNLVHFPVSKSKLWPAWNEFLETKGTDQWLKECERLEIDPDKPVFSYLLGTFDELPTLDTGNTDSLTIDSIKILNGVDKNTPILLKPHAITQLNRLSKILTKVNAKNVHVTYLHPSLMARFSVAVICNYYSTSIADFWHKGVPTIEFTRYSQQLLNLTENRSFGGDYIDHFIEMNEVEVLRSTLMKFFDKSYVNEKPKELLANLSDVDSLLISKLTQRSSSKLHS